MVMITAKPVGGPEVTIPQGRIPLPPSPNASRPASPARPPKLGEPPQSAQTDVDPDSVTLRLLEEKAPKLYQKPFVDNVPETKDVAADAKGGTLKPTGKPSGSKAPKEIRAAESDNSGGVGPSKSGRRYHGVSDLEPSSESGEEADVSDSEGSASGESLSPASPAASSLGDSDSDSEKPGEKSAKARAKEPATRHSAQNMQHDLASDRRALIAFRDNLLEKAKAKREEANEASNDIKTEDERFFLQGEFDAALAKRDPRKPMATLDKFLSTQRSRVRPGEKDPKVTFSEALVEGEQARFIAELLGRTTGHLDSLSTQLRRAKRATSTGSKPQGTPPSGDIEKALRAENAGLKNEKQQLQASLRDERAISDQFEALGNKAVGERDAAIAKKQDPKKKWKTWQLALAIGVPSVVALGLVGALIYVNRQHARHSR